MESEEYRIEAEDRNIPIDPGWPHFQNYTFAPAILRGNLLFLSGLTATDEAGEVVGKGDIVAQARCIFGKLKQILSAAGASLSDVVKTTDFITTTQGYSLTAEVRREFFGDSFPSSTGVVVSGLLRPDALIEIEAIAVVPGKGTKVDGQVNP